MDEDHSVENTIGQLNWAISNLIIDYIILFIYTDDTILSFRGYG